MEDTIGFSMDNEKENKTYTGQLNEPKIKLEKELNELILEFQNTYKVVVNFEQNIQEYDSRPLMLSLFIDTKNSIF